MFDLFSLNDFWFLLTLTGLAVFGAVIQADDGPDGPKDVQRKPDNSRKRRRQREERGLPSDQALRDLARTYLEVQTRLWPQLVKARVLPRLTDANVAKMATAFKRNFLGKEIGAFEPNIAGPPWSALAAGYIRYSCDKSSPRSLPQQLQLMLEKAHQNGHFIAWQDVFADAAITGTTAARSGYELAKTALQVDDHGIEVLYVDELGRASRDMVETMLLGRLVERLRKRLIGTSDGFDTEMPMWKTVLSIFGALQEWFIDQLRAKVNRGMEDAFYRGTNTGLPAIGYKLAPAVDAQGNPMLGRDGERLNMLVVDEEMAAYVRLIFELYVDKGWSLLRIARHFNGLKVGGAETWDGTRIRQFLGRRRYVGIEVYRTEHRYIDNVTGDIITEKRPRSEWLVRRARRLQIVPWKLWKKAHKRLKECRRAFSSAGNGSKSRTELYPKVLVRPVCGSCGKSMWLGRSGKYATFTCLNGNSRKHGCKSRGYKSVRIVEQAVLNHLLDQVLTEQRIIEWIVKANEYLAEEAAKPKPDLEPLKAEIKKEKARRDRLAKILDEEGEDDLSSLVTRLQGHERRLKELTQRYQEAAVRCDTPPPIDLADVDRILQDIRGLLTQDVAQAAPVIKALTGPVVVRQEQEPGKKRPTWIAEFSVNLVAAVVKLESTKDCPSSRTWVLLYTRSWTMGETVAVRLETPAKYERIAAEVEALAGEGLSTSAIAMLTNSFTETVHEALDFARTGRRPSRKTKKRTRRAGPARPPKYVEISGEVGHLCDVERLSFAEAARRLDVSVVTVYRAYDHLHPEEVRESARRKKCIDRTGKTRLAPADRDRIRAMIKDGARTCEIVAEVGCSRATVARMRKIAGGADSGDASERPRS